MLWNKTRKYLSFLNTGLVSILNVQIRFQKPKLTTIFDLFRYLDRKWHETDTLYCSHLFVNISMCSSASQCFSIIHAKCIVLFFPAFNSYVCLDIKHVTSLSQTNGKWKTKVPPLERNLNDVPLKKEKVRTFL